MAISMLYACGRTNLGRDEEPLGVPFQHLLKALPPAGHEEDKPKRAEKIAHIQLLRLCPDFMSTIVQIRPPPVMRWLGAGRSSSP